MTGGGEDALGLPPAGDRHPPGEVTGYELGGRTGAQEENKRENDSSADLCRAPSLTVGTSSVAVIPLFRGKSDVSATADSRMVGGREQRVSGPLDSIRREMHVALLRRHSNQFAAVLHAQLAM